MTFRRNKSKKVPNVKLRPAQTSSSGSKSHSAKGSRIARAHTDDSGFASSSSDVDGSVVYTDACPRPFKNIILCATGISDKTTLFKMAIELGAQSLSDLTDRVTHLIAEEPGSAKYKCALECQIPVMRPSWITESYEIWLKGDDVDLEESVAAHRLPIFTNIVLTLTNIEPIEKRTKINKLITHNGGTYVKNLERPVKVTHLLCGGGDVECNRGWQGEKTEKMMYAEKFNERGEADIMIVWEEWFWDCLDFGGKFDEESYKTTNARPKLKKLSKEATPPPQSSPPSSPTRSHRSTPLPNERPNGQRSTTRHADDEEEEIASVKRVDATKLQIWNTLLQPRGFSLSEGRLIRSPSKSQSRPALLPVDADLALGSPVKAKSKRILNDTNNGEGGSKGSMLASFRRSKSFAPATRDASTPKGPFKRVTTASASSSNLFRGGPSSMEVLAEGGEYHDLLVASSSRASRSGSFLLPVPVSIPEAHGKGTVTGTNEKKKRLFAGKTFRALGEAKGPSVRGAVEDCGGRMVSDGDEDDVDLIVVRLVSGSKIFREELDNSERTKYRTECWLERCMFEERICEPREHVSFTPIGVETPVPQSEVNLSFSGLDQSEACWVRRLLRALGITLTPNFSRRTTILLCPSRTGAKFEKAQEWNIPVVGMDWIESIVREGVIPPISAHSDDVLPLKADVKGKGKERAVDCKMVDITNSETHTASAEVRQSPDRMDGIVPEGLDDDSFGVPNDLLPFDNPAEPQPPDRQLIRTPSPPPKSRELDVGLSPLPSVNLCPNSTSDQSLFNILSRTPTIAEIEQDKVSTRIPSSESPSPMKPPSREGNSKGQVQERSHSPVGISRAATKVLQESITTLLGKRQHLEEDTVGLVGGNTRPGKRVRPPSKTKPQPRPDPLPLERPLVLPSPPQPINNPFNPYAGVSEDDISMLAGEGRGGNDSMRVTYKDPDEQGEKMRLMKLLQTQQKEVWEVDDGDTQPVAEQPRVKQGKSSKGGRKSADESTSASRRSRVTRRSTRVAGF